MVKDLTILQDRQKEETKVTDSAYQPFRLQNQYADRERGYVLLATLKRVLVFFYCLTKQIKNNKSDKRDREYQLAKRFCDTPVSPQASICATLSVQINHAKRCIEL